MKMTLTSMKIENFRVIKSFEISPNGSNLAVFGKNKRGKTTLYDAFLWLLFGKNSAGETKFTIKPTTIPEETENSVEAEFEVDGKPLILKKVYASKYVKATGEYKSSELEYYINGVPKKKNEYEAYISEIINEGMFKLLTNPKHFMETLKWDERRKILFEMTEKENDVELCSRNPTFALIAEDIERCGSTTELAKAILMQMKNNSKRINDLPQRISENAIKLTDISQTEEELNAEIGRIKSEIVANTEKIGALKAQSEVAESAEYLRLKQEYNDFLAENDAFRREQENKRRGEIDSYNNAYNALNSRKRELDTQKTKLEIEIQYLSNKRNELLKNRKAILDRKWEASEICPTCGQAIPQEKLEKAVDRSEGAVYFKEIKKLEAANGELEMKMYQASDSISKIHENIALCNRIDELKDEQKKLRNEQAKLQQKNDLVNDFIRFKVNNITESINKKFALARFKLFEPNKTNDGLQECCEALAFNASRYNDINTAGKILVGVDIIKTLAEHYNLSVPLFIDNIDGLDSDSYTQLTDSISGTMQLITLRVSDDDDTLRTEAF